MSDRPPAIVVSRPGITWLGFAVAVVTTGATTGIGLALDLEGKPGMGALYVGAVAVTTYAGGLWAGLLASGMAFIAYEYFFVGGTWSFGDIDAKDSILAGVLLALCALVVAQVVERMRVARRDAETALAALAESEQRARAIAREQEAVAALGRSALTGVGVTALLEEAIRHVGDILDVRCAEVLQTSTGGSELVVAHGIGLAEDVGSVPIRISLSTPEGRAVTSNQPVLLQEDDPGDLAPPAYVSDPDVVSHVAVPIRGLERPWGILAAHSGTAEAFSQTDLYFLRGIANVLGAAILRREAEIAQRETRDELHALIQASPIPIVAYDVEGCVTLWNPAAERVFGWTAEEVAGELLPFVHPEMLDEFHTVRRRVLAGEQFSDYETVRRRKDGTRIDVSFSNAPVRDATGRIRGVVALVADITDRKRIERALREGEQRLRLALESAEMGTWEWDLETNAVTWSESLEPIHGLEPGTFEGTFEHYRSLIHPDDRAFVLGAIEAALDERDPGYDIEFRIVWPDGSEHWLSGQGQVLRDDGGKPLRMIGLARDVTARKRREEGLAFMAEAAEALAATLDFERMLRELTRLTVPRLADCCLVDVLDGEGGDHQLAVAHVDPAKEVIVRELESRYPADPRAERSVVGSVLRSGKPLLVSHVDDAVAREIAREEPHLEGLRRLRIDSILVAPLVVRGQTIGAITLLSGGSGRHFGAEDVAFVTDLARQAALALDNARVHRQRSDIATTLQRSLLPPDLPEIPGVELAAGYFPAGEGLEVGGDFYDAFQTGENMWSIVIGDVCGKGSEAAAVTGLTRHTLRGAAVREPSPGASLAVLNEALLRGREDRTFCTVVKGRLETTRDGARLMLACGGHPPPIRVTSGGALEEVGTPGSLVGFFDDPEFTDVVVELRPGDAVFFYTDGLVEGRGEQMAVGARRLKDLLAAAAGRSADEIGRLVEETVMSEDRSSIRDDTAFLVLRVTPRT